MYMDTCCRSADVEVSPPAALWQQVGRRAALRSPSSAPRFGEPAADSTCQGREESQ